MWNTLLSQARSRVREMLKSPWIVARENTRISPQRYGETTLFALIGTWHEEDIIYASAKNAFAQGCDRVFIVDNCSPDNTVEEALSAGATLARSFETHGYDEQLRIRMMTEVMQEVSQSTGLETVWWVWLDADEFPEGPDGLPLKEFLNGLHPRFRLVGVKYVNHFPVDLPHYIPRFHPLEFQPWCEEFDASEFHHCALGHWKHPLIKYVSSRAVITPTAGTHRAMCKEQLVEPTEGIIIHHFPYRDKEATYGRLEELCTPREDGTIRNQMNDDRIGHPSGINKRYRNLENVYSGRWHKVDNLHIRPPTTGVDLRLLEHPVAHRWYSDEELLNAKGHT